MKNGINKTVANRYMEMREHLLSEIEVVASSAIKWI